MMTHTAWYIARATGYVAWGLLTVTVVLGLVFSARLGRGKVTPAWLLDLHRFVGGASVIFTGLHVGGLIVDNYVHFNVIDVLVPFASEWRPGAVALGVIAMYLLAAVEISSLAMKRLPRTWWRKIHMSSHALFWVATFHLLTAGTDADSPVSQVVTALVISLVVFLTLVRVLSDGRLTQRSSPRTNIEAHTVDRERVGPTAE